MTHSRPSLPFSVWAIADLHLSFGTPNKEMDIFGKEWIGWTETIQRNWKEKILPEDLVLIAGDISWAKHLEQAIPDFEWIDKLPGTKVMIRGNHDYWWNSKSKIVKALPQSLHIIQNDVFNYRGVSVAGSRLWDTPEYTFKDYVVMKEIVGKPEISELPKDTGEAEKIFERELGRLEMSLKMLEQAAQYKITMTHYPPIDASLAPSRASRLLENYHVDACVFGHLHSVRPNSLPFGEKNGVRYYLTSCDYLNFSPLKII